MLIQWEQCLHDFLRSMEVRSKETSTSYRGVLTRFLAQCEPDKVTRTQIENFMHSPSMRGRGPAIATQNLRLSAISSFYKYASTYVPEGEKRLFAVISDVSLIGIRDRAVLLLYFWTARRRSELASLRYGDITETSFPDGHGGMRKAYVLAFRGKGHKSEIDHQEIPQPAMDAITWYLVASGRIETIQANSPLFSAVGREPGKGGNVRPGEVRILSAKGIANRIALYAKEAGLHASLHTLRHTSSRARFESGENIRSIQHLLRHQNLSTTDVYLRSLVGSADLGYKLLDEKYRHL